jgi:hypothetical protein
VPPRSVVASMGVGQHPARSRLAMSFVLTVSLTMCTGAMAVHSVRRSRRTPCRQSKDGLG